MLNNRLCTSHSGSRQEANLKDVVLNILWNLILAPLAIKRGRIVRCFNRLFQRQGPKRKKLFGILRSMGCGITKILALMSMNNVKIKYFGLRHDNSVHLSSDGHR